MDVYCLVGIPRLSQFQGRLLCKAGNVPIQLTEVCIMPGPMEWPITCPHIKATTSYLVVLSKSTETANCIDYSSFWCFLFYNR